MARKKKPKGGGYPSVFETGELRSALKNYFRKPLHRTFKHVPTVGKVKWGVYIFYDYDGEPIYVGQTKEGISTRISRHLTNQRTDAVAMSVLDPFEVHSIAVFPLPQFQGVHSKHSRFKVAEKYLNALEYQIHQKAIAASKFRAILNEKDPVAPSRSVKVPEEIRECIVTADVLKLRGHPDVRLARRAQVIARLAQTVMERQVQPGLRRTLLTQAKRLRALAQDRFDNFGESSVEKGPEAAREEAGDGD